MGRRKRVEALLFLLGPLFLVPFRLSAIVMAGYPDDYLSNFGTGMDGVTSLEVIKGASSVGCTGVLLSTGRHVLTAAHCVANSAGLPDVFGLTALFETAGVVDQIDYAGVAVYPQYTGDPFGGNDLAIITLSRLAPGEADRYRIYRGSDELGQIAEIAGYGLTGQGRLDNTFPAGRRRVGLNRLDSDGSAFHFAGGQSLLLYDFDNGVPRNDGFGVVLGRHDLGQGPAEGIPAHGDSGGPTFLNGAVAGIHSFSFRASSSDVDNTLNQSFGEFSADVRLSKYADWIEAEVTVPEPPTLTLVVPTLFILSAFLLRRRSLRGF
jgi:hypothetical protein